MFMDRTPTNEDNSFMPEGTKGASVSGIAREDRISLDLTIFPP
jgi:hypothetical protein